MKHPDLEVAQRGIVPMNRCASWPSAVFRSQSFSETRDGGFRIDLPRGTMQSVFLPGDKAKRVVLFWLVQLPVGISVKVHVRVVGKRGGLCKS